MYSLIYYIFLFPFFRQIIASFSYILLSQDIKFFWGNQTKKTRDTYEEVTSNKVHYLECRFTELEWNIGGFVNRSSVDEKLFIIARRLNAVDGEFDCSNPLSDWLTVSCWEVWLGIWELTDIPRKFKLLNITILIIEDKK